MKTSHFLSLLGASTFVAAFGSQAQCTKCTGCTNDTDNLYFGIAAGGAIQQSISIHTSPFGNSGNVEFKPGLRADLHLGYNLSRSFAVELQTGIIWNPVNNFAGNSVSAGLYEVPILANVIYRPLHGAFQPYLGIGAGGAVSTFDSSNIPLFTPNYSATDWTFAYQAQVGFDYAVSPSAKFGLAYELLGTTEHDWNSGGFPFKTAGTLTHALVASFIWEF